jgi:site-specific recombinase XerC
METISAPGSTPGSSTSGSSALAFAVRSIGTHSLRRTKASIIYKATGNLRAVQILLGHAKIENTVRYLGVDVENALTLAEGTEI